MENALIRIYVEDAELEHFFILEIILNQILVVHWFLILRSDKYEFRKKYNQNSY